MVLVMWRPREEVLGREAIEDELRVRVSLRETAILEEGLGSMVLYM